MPTSAIGLIKANGKISLPVLRRSAGFSLVEIMVVMLVLALATGLVLLTLPDQRPSLHDTAQKFGARAQLAAQSATIRNSMTGIEISSVGYRFTTRRMGVWVDHPGLGEPGIVYPWPEGVQPTLSIEGEKISLPGSLDLGTERAPSLYFTPGGEASPFRLDLSDGMDQTQVQGSHLGIIRMGDLTAGETP